MSLCLMSLLYCIFVCIIQHYFRDGNDAATGILYCFSTILYLVGLWLSFMLYGSSKIRKTLCGISCVVFLFIYSGLWVGVNKAMPYESIFYIAYGLLIYTSEFLYLKHNQK